MCRLLRVRVGLDDRQLSGVTSREAAVLKTSFTFHLTQYLSERKCRITVLLEAVRMWQIVLKVYQHMSFRKMMPFDVHGSALFSKQGRFCEMQAQASHVTNSGLTELKAQPEHVSITFCSPKCIKRVFMIIYTDKC